MIVPAVVEHRMPSKPRGSQTQNPRSRSKVPRRTWKATLVSPSTGLRTASTTRKGLMIQRQSPLKLLIFQRPIRNVTEIYLDSWTNEHALPLSTTGPTIESRESWKMPRRNRILKATQTMNRMNQHFSRKKSRQCRTCWYEAIILLAFYLSGMALSCLAEFDYCDW